MKAPIVGVQTDHWPSDQKDDDSGDSEGSRSDGYG